MIRNQVHEMPCRMRTQIAKKITPRPTDRDHMELGMGFDCSKRYNFVIITTAHLCFDTLTVGSMF